MKTSLTKREAQLLTLLREQSNRGACYLSNSELGELMGIDRSNATHLVARLRAKGYISATWMVDQHGAILRTIQIVD